MHSCDILTPPVSEFESMDHGQRLPSITTQLAGYFQQKPNTPPVSPHDPRHSDSSSLKRKRSDQESISAGSAQHDSKKLAREWMETRPSTNSTHQRHQSLSPFERAKIGPTQIASPSSRLEQARTMQRPKSSSYSPRRANAASPEVGSSHSGFLSAPGSYVSTPVQSGGVRPQNDPSGDAGSRYDERHNSARSLPPLNTPQSPIGATEAKLDDSSHHASRQQLPPLDPNGGYRQPPGAYPYPNYSSSSSYGSNTMPTAGTPTNATSRSDMSSYNYSSDPHHSSQHQSTPFQAPYNYDTTRSSYSFDSGHHPSYSGDERRVALPSMPGLTDPIPSTGLNGAMPNAMRPAHSLEHYRFDGNSGADHPSRRRRGNLPKEATARLNEWFAIHASYPYPKEEEKQRLQEETGLSMSQIGNWFINARRRRKPNTGARLVDTLPPPPPGRHTYASQTLPPHLSAPLPPHHLSQPLPNLNGPAPSSLPSLPPSSNEPAPYDYARLPPPYGRP